MNSVHLIDFHCHVDLFDNYIELINKSESQQIYTLAVTTTPRAWTRNRDLTQNTRYVKAALGLHPQLVKIDSSAEFALWEHYMSETRYIGEVGLDASPDFINTFDEQKRVFGRILKCCANMGNKILSVHSVRSASVVLDLLENFLPPNRSSVVLHWFSGNLKEARRAVDLGCYFSINLPMLNTKKGQELVKSLPINKLITETDAPFTNWENRISEPTNIIDIVGLLSQIRGYSKQEISRIIFSNFRSLIKKNA